MVTKPRAIRNNSEREALMKCPTCGQIIRTEREFCALCGTPLKKKKSHGGLIALIVVLALIAAGLSFYLFYWKDRPAPEPQETVIVAADSAAEASAEEEIRIDAPEQDAQSVQSQAALFTDGAEIYAMPSYSLVLRQDGTVAVAGRSASPEFGFDLFDWTGIRQVLPTDYFVAGLTEEGRVRLTGEVSGYEDAARWTDVAHLYYDADTLFGLTKDGHVLSAGPDVEFDPGELEDIVNILPGQTDTIAVAFDGRVTVMRHRGGLWDIGGAYGLREVAVGSDFAMYLMEDGTVRSSASLYKILDRNNWENPYFLWDNMKKLLIGDWFVVGLKQDGTVLCQTHIPGEAVPDTSSWRGVRQILLDREHSIVYGLTEEGRVLSAMAGDKPELPVDSWENVQELQLNGRYWAALTKDGRVLTASFPETSATLDTHGWEHVKAISLGSGHLLGLLEDGSVLAVGDNSAGQCG